MPIQSKWNGSRWPDVTRGPFFAHSWSTPSFFWFNYKKVSNKRFKSDAVRLNKQLLKKRINYFQFKCRNNQSRKIFRFWFFGQKMDIWATEQSWRRWLNRIRDFLTCRLRALSHVDTSGLVVCFPQCIAFWLLKVQWKPLNENTWGPKNFNLINRMKTLIEWILSSTVQ